MFYALGLFAYRRRRAVIAIWAILLLLSAPLSLGLQSVLSGGGFANGTTEADRALALMQGDLHVYPSAVTIIFSSPTLRVDAPAFKADMTAALDRVQGLPTLVRVDTYDSAFGSPTMVSPDRHSTYATLNFSVPLEQTQANLPLLHARLHTQGLHTIVTGDPPVYADMEQLSIDDLATVERYTFPVALVLLILVFGTLVAAGVPLIIGGVSVAVTLGVIFLLGHVANLSIFALNVTTMIGLGVGIDYALLIVSRFREERQRRPLDQAIAVTISRAGRAILFSGGTVMLGLSGLLIFQATALRSMGLGGVIVVAVAVLATLTLVPAVLGVLGDRIDALAIVPQRAGVGTFWPTLARVVMRRPWPFIAVTLLAVTAIALPARNLRLNIPDATILPQWIESRHGFDIMQQTFKVNTDTPTLSIVYDRSGPIVQPRFTDALYTYVRRLQRDPEVRQVQSIVNLDPGLTQADYRNLPALLANPVIATVASQLVGTHATMIIIYPKHGLSDSAGEALVRRLRAVPIAAGLQHDLGGYTAGKMDYIRALYDDFPKAILFVLISTFIVLLLLFRSVVLPLKAVVMNLLSLFGSYGALVFVFQEGHLSHLLSFTPSGYTDEITPIVMFCTLFGISMDYEVFLLSRIREEYLATGDNQYAVEQGLARTGRIITSAALILVVVAGSFAFTNLILVKAVGLGLALAIVIDATLIRTLLVPATMRVLGHWNWWAPRWLDPLLSRVDRLIGPLEESPEAGERVVEHQLAS